MSTYRQMGYSPSTLENPSRILIEFNKATTISQGNVVLPVLASPIIFNVYFLVIEDLPSYNAIMGRVWLHKMKVIPSMYHQMTSYLTEAKQVDLHGNQLASRQCYQVTVEAGQ